MSSAVMEYGLWAAANPECVIKSGVGTDIKIFQLCWVTPVSLTLRKTVAVLFGESQAISIYHAASTHCHQHFYTFSASLPSSPTTALVQCIMCACQAFFFAIR
jgi:hypothetical protein